MTSEGAATYTAHARLFYRLPPRQGDPVFSYDNGIPVCANKRIVHFTPETIQDAFQILRRGIDPDTLRDELKHFLRKLTYLGVCDNVGSVAPASNQPSARTPYHICTFGVVVKGLFTATIKGGALVTPSAFTGDYVTPVAFVYSAHDRDRTPLDPAEPAANAQDVLVGIALLTARDVLYRPWAALKNRFLSTSATGLGLAVPHPGGLRRQADPTPAFNEKMEPQQDFLIS